MNKPQGFFSTAAALVLFAGAAQAAPWEIANTNFETDVTGWSAFNGTVEFQAINSPNDSVPGGSALLTFSAVNGSISIPITVDSATIDTTVAHELDEVSFDLAHDGSLTALAVGFYRINAYDVFVDGSKDIIAIDNPPADTDGTLDTFTTITLPAYTTPVEGANQILLFIGTSASTVGYVGASAGSKIAVDNFKIGTTSSINDWTLYAF